MPRKRKSNKPVVKKYCKIDGCEKQLAYNNISGLCIDHTTKSDQNARWYQNNRTEIRKKHNDNKEEINAHRRKIARAKKEIYHCSAPNCTHMYKRFRPSLLCKSCKFELDRSTRTERRREYHKKYDIENKDKTNARARNKYQNDPQVKLKNILRSRMGTAVRAAKAHKVGSAVKDLGCTIGEFKEYLESLFQPGMNWENYGKNGWHMDHIIPLASFDLSNREQFLKACHYTNIQPLWWLDNISKGSKVPDDED